MRRLALACALSCACSVTVSDKPVKDTPTATRTKTPAYSDGAQAGAGSVAPLCPAWTPVNCGTWCCPYGDTCQGGRCQETPSSIDCHGGVACGQHCYPAGTVCTAFEVLCPATAPVYCGSNTALDAQRCCAPSTTCTAAGWCGRFASLPAGGVACGYGVGSCAAGFACNQQAGDWTCSPGTPPVGVLPPCVVPCGAGCCGRSDTSGKLIGPQGACVSGACVYPARDALPADCPAAEPALCGPGLCCPAAAVCGACGCPAGQQKVCGSACCKESQVCGLQGGCEECTPDHPLACDPDGCCLPDAPCTSGHCGCGAGEVECGNYCCPAGDGCEGTGADLGCARCPAELPGWCDGSCCAASDTCRQCPTDSHPVCHSGACPPAPPLQCDASEYAATCPNGTQRCCSVHMVCCRDSMNGGAIGCEFTGFCQ